MKKTIQIIASLFSACAIIASPLFGLVNNVNAAYGSYTWVDASGDEYECYSYVNSNACSLTLVSDNGDGRLSCPSSVNGYDVSYFECHNFIDITSIDFSNCSTLATINCSGTSISELDASNNPNLRSLYCYDNANLTELNVNGCVNLEMLVCFNTSISSVDLSCCTDLYFLQIWETNIDNSTIESINSTRLGELYLGKTNVTSLDLSRFPNLHTVGCEDCDIASLDISHNPVLLRLYLTGHSDEWNGNILTLVQGDEWGDEQMKSMYYDAELEIITGENYMFRFYNPNSGEHFYTNSGIERNNLVIAGWDYEGVAWIAPESGDSVYRLYNPNAGDHHYTTSSKERDNLVEVGWIYEGIGWYSAGTNGTPLYRLYNPNAIAAGAHHYTTSEEESSFLQSLGWHYEGIGWFGN